MNGESKRGPTYHGGRYSMWVGGGAGSGNFNFMYMGKELQFEYVLYVLHYSR